MALVPCARCRQPFYASCHDASCVGAVCPYCEYGDDEPRVGDASTGGVSTPAVGMSTPVMGSEERTRRGDEGPARVAYRAR